ncbi:MAG: DUF1501 domain-containing protein, partial [Deltaproteobacteria bacterium]|nr:DUF1501 domain-containing protein [Deltaproteobacteria bacterium]
NKTIAMSIGGFDTHSNQLTDLPKLISSLAGGLHGLFYTVRKKRPCLFKKFAVYVMSEFGRTIRANTGMSTDHGWGSVLMAIFGSYNPIPRNQRLDRELGPQFILTRSASERDNIRRMNSADYARELSHLHLDIDPMHLYPKISMHSALALILSKSLNVPAGNLQQFFNEIMLPEFYKKNYVRYSDEMRLWTEFLDGIPGWA